MDPTVDSHGRAYLASVLLQDILFYICFATCKPFKSTTTSLDGHVRDAASSDPLSADQSNPGVLGLTRVRQEPIRVVWMPLPV
jgi:hypothetical protein